MSEPLSGHARRFVARLCERLLHDLHHLGVAIMPAICERVFWIAILSVAVFLAFIAIQILTTEG